MKEPNKPRTFYVQIGADNLDINKPYRRYVSAQPFGGSVGDEDWPNAEVIQMIEKGHADALEQKLARYEQAYSLEYISGLEQQLKEVNEVCGSLMKANADHISKSIQRIDKINALESANAELTRKLAIAEKICRTCLSDVGNCGQRLDAELNGATE